jgi:hypothetical protein
VDSVRGIYEYSINEIYMYISSAEEYFLGVKAAGA